jgi:hypothetical protein
LHLFGQRANIAQAAGVGKNSVYLPVQFLFSLVKRCLAAAGYNNGGALF